MSANVGRREIRPSREQALNHRCGRCFGRWCLNLNRWRTCDDSPEIQGFSTHACVLTTTLGVPYSLERRLGAVKDGKPSYATGDHHGLVRVWPSADSSPSSRFPDGGGVPSDGDGSRLRMGCSSHLAFCDLVLFGFAAFADRSMDSVMPNLWSSTWRALKTTGYSRRDIRLPTTCPSFAGLGHAS
jgi:hypothetical protein